MKIISENSLRQFEFWSGAVDRVSQLMDGELDIIESILEDAYPDGMTETEINDLFWFEEDTIAEWLGYENWERLEFSNELGIAADELAELIEDYYNIDQESAEEVEAFKNENNLTDRNYEHLTNIA